MLSIVHKISFRAFCLTWDMARPFVQWIPSEGASCL